MVLIRCNYVRMPADESETGCRSKIADSMPLAEMIQERLEANLDDGIVQLRY